MKKLLVLALLLLSCDSPNSSPSELNWGALSGVDRSQTFLVATTMLICGNASLIPVANNALWEWNNARGVHHTLFTSPYCDRRREYSASVKVAFGNCNRGVVGYHTQSGNHHDVTLCNGLDRSYWQRVMLHEVGHAAVGACDTYVPGNAAMIAFHPNCHPYLRTTALRSVMNGLSADSPSQLTADDIAYARWAQRNLR
jgi:hypothetical protein